ncbi:MAG: dihydrofolate reductase family protein [Pseudomonadota bacterium]
MAAVRIYCGVSLDGCVADADGDTSWLQPYEATIFQDSGFLDDIGAVVLGRRAFEFLYAFGEWPYGEKHAFIVSSILETKLPARCSFVRSGVRDAIAAAEIAAGEKDVWVVGGAMMLQSAFLEGVVERIEMCVVPVLVGQGLSVMGGLNMPRTLAFDGITTYPQDIIKLSYDIKP